MIFPQTVTYALEALCYLAHSAPGTFIKVKEISSKLDIPEHFLGKVLTQLVRKKLIVSSKGPTGGVSLVKDPSDFTVYDVMKALDVLDPLEDSCLLGLETCTQTLHCAFHDDWDQFKKKITSRAKKTTLAKLAKK
jgi:Rrf2 family protein